MRRTGESDIFVQIPAYRDRELSATLIDLYGQASQPGRLRTAVMWQKGPRERLDHCVSNLPNLEIISVPAKTSKGCNWARSFLQTQWHGERYTLLLDSHHRFVAGWDDIVIDMYEALLAHGVMKPLITGYLPSYDPELEPYGRLQFPMTIYPKGREQGLLVKLTSYPMPFWERLAEPQLAEFLSLHFVFTAGSFNSEVAFDPDIYFFGDEVVTGLRAHTWGYDMFHPHKLIGWHCYSRSKRIPHWNDHADWQSRHAKSLLKIRRLFTGDDGGRGLFGQVRSPQSYAKLVSIPLIAES